MDCLFRSDETQALDNYIRELRIQQREPVIYAGLNWFPEGCSWMSVMDYTKGCTKITGMYRGARVIPFDGIDDDVCCVLPQS